MNEGYWNALSEEFDGAVFDVFDNDCRGILRRSIEKYAAKAKVGADFGCGVGRMVPFLAPMFRELHALDFAPDLLEEARVRCAGLDNVHIMRADLSRSVAGLDGIDLAICVNTLLSPDDRKRRSMLRSILRSLADRGHLIVVVPSLESELFANMRLVEWNRRARSRQRGATDGSIRRDSRGGRDLLAGVINLDGVRTKHYLKAELSAWFRESGVEEISIDKIEYPWDTYFYDPPGWMGEPRPWDWLFIGRMT